MESEAAGCRSPRPRRQPWPAPSTRRSTQDSRTAPERHGSLSTKPQPNGREYRPRPHKWPSRYSRTASYKLAVRERSRRRLSRRLCATLRESSPGATDCDRSLLRAKRLQARCYEVENPNRTSKPNRRHYRSRRSTSPSCHINFSRGKAGSPFSSNHMEPSTPW